uniref:LysM domain-containing protein n=1 Tax=Meloidogyne hapla TaxID=6305 RepID=A0A1I8B689_MELHA
MFRLDRRIRSASSRIRKLENSAEAALVKAQQTAVRSLSLRSRSSRQQQDSHKRHSNTLLGFLDLSPRKNKTNGEDCSRSTPPRKQNLDEGSIKEMNYVEVQNTDTLEGIAAAHDCTVGFLVKLNKLTSRMVFPGQKLLVPSFDETQAVSSSEKLDNKLIKEKSSGIHRGPGHAVPIPPNEIPLRSALANKFYRHTTTASNFQNIPSKDDNEPEFGRSASELDPEDQDCLQRFMKIKVKQITESDGTIIGTLLVTPNCLMFDPDVDHPLVQEKGSDLYGMVANMENIISVTVYKHISSLTGEKQNKEEDIFDPERVTSTPRMSIAGSRQGSPSSISKNQRISSFDKGENIKDTKTGSNEEERRDDTSFEGDQTIVYGTSAGTLLPGSYTSNASSDGESSNISNSEQLPCIDEERETQLRNEAIEREKRPRNEKQSTSVEESNVLNKQHEKRLSEGSQVVAFLDLDEDSDQSGQRLLNQMDSLDITKSSEQSQRRSPLPFSRYSPGMARKSFGKLGRTLSAKATSFKGSVQSVASGTQKVAHGVVSHTLSAADHIQAGIQNSAKVVASVPGSIMNISTGLIQEGQNGVMEVVESVKDVLSNESNEQQQQQVDKQTMKRERSLATLESLYQRTQQAREQAAIQRALDTGFVLGTEERSVFEKKQKYNDITNNNGQNDRNSIDSPPEPPYYMTVRVDRSRQQRKKTQISRRNSKEIVDSTGASLSASDFFESGCLFGNRRKREFWFAVPRSRVDAIYHFLLQWSPQKYGQVKASSADETNVIDENTSNEMISTGMNAKQDFGAFVVLDRDVDDETLTGWFIFIKFKKSKKDSKFYFL